MDDYISREKVLKKIQMQLLDLEADQDKGEYSELCENRGARDALDEAIYDIRTIKAADVQPVRHGKWNSWGRDTAYNKFYRCSYCGCEISIDNESRELDDTLPKYCMNCGAEMGG